MGFLFIFLVPMSIFFAILSYVNEKNKNRRILSIFSFVCLIIPLILSIHDINDRINSNDIGGIMDIYPTMVQILVVVFITILIFNILSILKHD